MARPRSLRGVAEKAKWAPWRHHGTQRQCLQSRDQAFLSSSPQKQAVTTAAAAVAESTPSPAVGGANRHGRASWRYQILRHASTWRHATVSRCQLRTTGDFCGVGAPARLKSMATELIAVGDFSCVIMHDISASEKGACWRMRHYK